jgi:hypothetical protein
MGYFMDSMGLEGLAAKPEVSSPTRQVGEPPITELVSQAYKRHLAKGHQADGS